MIFVEAKNIMRQETVFEGMAEHSSSMQNNLCVGCR